MQQQGESYIVLRDPTGVAPEPIMIGMGAYFLVTLFDGNQTELDLQAAFTRRFGEVLPSEHLRQLIDGLDRAFFLLSPAYEERMSQIRQQFTSNPQRPAALAGLAYESDPARLRAEIAGFFQRPGAPGQIPSPRNDDQPLSGLISPHIDPRRGGAAYAHAYGELLTRPRPELVVILGTSHYATGPELFTCTRKNYLTPLGAVATDTEFVDRLATRCEKNDLFAAELLHRNEHSIEFQALFLAWALGTRGYKVVPILVSSFHEMVASGRVPGADDRVASFIQALRDELAAESRSVCIIAGVDFAHVGRKFGDQRPADEAYVKWVEDEDRGLIENIVQGDPEGFFRAIDKDKDSRRICGLAPMYTQLEMLRGHRGRLLKYDIALEPPTQSAVSFASLAID